MVAGLSGRNICASCGHRLALRNLYRPPPSKKLHLNSHIENNDFPPPDKQADDVKPSQDNQRWVDSKLMSLGEKLQRHFTIAEASLKETIYGRASNRQNTGEAYSGTTQSSASTGVSDVVQTRPSVAMQDGNDSIARTKGLSAMTHDLFPMNGRPLSNELFRMALVTMRQVGEKGARKVISEQLLRCHTPQEILRCVTIAMQQPWTAKQLAKSNQPIARSIYRSRNNATDERALATISIIILSLKRANLPIHQDLLYLGAKFAARARSLGGMKRFLKEIKAMNKRMTKTHFRALIAKMSVGKRGYGEIRNGRWLRRDLLQVLLGFDNPDTERPYHLETFLVRRDWMYLHAWITILARCKAVDQLHHEWNLWLANPSRLCEKKLATKPDNIDSKNVTTKIRGDYWFIEQMCYAGDVAKAWKILEFTEIPFSNLRPTVQSMLLSEPQHATIWNADVQQAMLRKYDEEMTKIEAAVGAKWINTGPDGQGHHVIPGNYDSDNEKWEKLTDADLEEVSPPGFPWESDPVVVQAQKELNEAEEVDS